MKNQNKLAKIGYAFISSLLLMFAMTEPAYAQLSAPVGLANIIQLTLTAIGLTLLTCAFMWVGYKMIFQHAKWAEVSNVFIGGMFIGGAPLLAAAVMALR